MEPSEEVREATLEMVRCVLEGDAAGWSRLWSARDGVVSVGSDRREQLSGYDAITAVSGSAMQARGPISGVVEHCVAWQEGSVGWGVALVGAEWDGRPIEQPFRLSGVFHLERGQWKLCHSHRSFAIFDDELGFDLTSVLEGIAETVQRERPSVAAGAAPNGTVTILFTDIEGSTRLTESMGDRAWMSLLREHNAIVREQAARHAGFEVKSQGDGFMLAFPSSGSALRCAIGIQRALANRPATQEPLSVRIGLHTGEAIREAEDFYGKTVIMAARIAAEARGSEILCSSLVRELSEGAAEFQFTGQTETELKGLTGIHRLFSIEWRGEVERSPR